MSFNRKGLFSVSPILFFLVFLLAGSLIAGDFAKIQVSVAFLFSAIYAIAIAHGSSLSKRIGLFARGAGAPEVMFMISIFIVAGAFARTAQEMGCIEETVNIILKTLPSKYILVSIFLTGCIVSMATGSGIGSIIALSPIAVGVGEQIGGNMPLICATVVCGAMFGDNLSFISDTTIISTSTQGCQLKDKFWTNLWIAAPAAVTVTLVYLYLGRDFCIAPIEYDVQYIKVIPYLLVIILSMFGLNVLIVLLSGTLLCGIMGMAMGEFDFFGWLGAISNGINDTGSIVILVLLASGTMAMIKHIGGIEFLIKMCTRFVRSQRSAETCIAILTALVTLCTSNNTIAIITVSSVVKELSGRFGVDPRKAASIMDTSSCVALELIPYSTHILVAAAFAGIPAASVVPFVYYAAALGFFMVISIVFKIPRLKPVDKTA